MPNTKVVLRLKSVTICRRGARLALRYRDTNGKTVVRSVRTDDLDSAKIEAERIHDDLIRADQLIRTSSVGLLRIDTAIEKGIAMSRAKSTGHIRNMVANAKRLTAWLTKHYPGLVYWHELRPSIVVRFIEQQIAKGRRPQTIKLQLNPLRLANAYVQLVDPDSYRSLRFSHPQLIGEPVVKRYLEREQLCRLLEHVQDKRDRNSEIAVLLCGFCGLRISEATRLSVEDLDVPGNMLHTGFKTMYAPRSIPIPGWIMRRLMELAPVSGLLITRRGAPVDERDFGHLYLQKHLDAVSPKKRISARNLRTTFASMAAVADVPKEEQRAYMGQRLATVLEEHYADYSRPDILRQRVVDRIERHFAAPAAEVKQLHANG